MELGEVLQDMMDILEDITEQNYRHQKEVSETLGKMGLGIGNLALEIPTENSFHEPIRDLRKKIERLKKD